MNVIPLLHNTCIAGIHNPPVLITDKNTPIVIPFGPMGMPVQMMGRYSYLGDGKQLAEEWINMPDEE